MSDELYVMSGMARLDTIHADRVAVRRVAGLAPVEVVHRKRRVTRNLVQTLSVRHRLLDGVLIVEDLVATDDRLHTTREAQPPETIVEDLVEFQRRRRVVRYLYTSRQTVEDAIPTEDRMTLSGYEHARLGVPEYVILFQDS